MAGGIDTSKRKPRQIRGTPAVSFINRNSLFLLMGSVVIGLLMLYVFFLVFKCSTNTNLHS